MVPEPADLPAGRIRAATVEDSLAIGRLHVAAWRETYRGLIPDSVLDALSEESRTEQWRSGLSRGAKGPIVFVAEGADGSLIGFGAAGPARDPKLGCDSEVTALYVLRSGQRRGVGNALMRKLAEALRDRGRQSTGLWVHVGNSPARRFYEKLGGSATGTRTDRSDGWTCDEVAYVWRDLDPD
jgi:ribosomal protein S18 acetylase RimI-like enzyme